MRRGEGYSEQERIRKLLHDDTVTASIRTCNDVSRSYHRPVTRLQPFSCTRIAPGLLQHRPRIAPRLPQVRSNRRRRSSREGGAVFVGSAMTLGWRRKAWDGKLLSGPLCRVLISGGTWLWNSISVRRRQLARHCRLSSTVVDSEGSRETFRAALTVSRKDLPISLEVTEVGREARRCSVRRSWVRWRGSPCC